MTLLAVTDHDTLDGVAEARAAGERLGVRVVAGVELSVRAPSGSMHLLGYFGEDAPEPIASRLAALREDRRRRAEQMVARCVAAGAPIRMADVLVHARGSIGRPHVAAALVAAGHADDTADAFARFLADGAPAYVPHEALTPEEAVRLVDDSGGGASLAHPGSLRMPTAELMRFAGVLAGAGLRGIEVHRPEHTPEHRAEYGAVAARHGLVPTGGSDFHGRDTDAPPGDTGDPPLPPEALDRLLRYPRTP